MNLLYPLAKRFIAGHDFDSAIPVISQLMLDGYDITIDYLGELSKTDEDCQKAWKQYVDIIEYYGLLHIPIDISIKPTQLGLLLDKVECECRLIDLVTRAYVYGITIRLDMEDSNVTQDTIDLCLRIHKEHSNIGIALQSNLYRTEKDLSLMMDKEISVRLVKGAYKEDINIAYQRKDLLHDVYIKQAFRLISDRSRSYYHYKNDTTPLPALGTHDEQLLDDILGFLNRFNVKKDDLFIEMLYGIRRDLSSSLLNQGYCVRLYVPFGADWLPYTLRRLREFKNLKFMVSNIVKEMVSDKTDNIKPARI
jgi:proline dehydrogenase